MLIVQVLPLPLPRMILIILRLIHSELEPSIFSKKNLWYGTVCQYFPKATVVLVLK